MYTTNDPVKREWLISKMDDQELEEGLRRLQRATRPLERPLSPREVRIRELFGQADAALRANDRRQACETVHDAVYLLEHAPDDRQAQVELVSVSQDLPAGEETYLLLRLRNTGSDMADGRDYEFSCPTAQHNRLGQGAVKLAPNEEGTERVRVTFPSPGEHRCQFTYLYSDAQKRGYGNDWQRASFEFTVRVKVSERALAAAKQASEKAAEESAFAARGLDAAKKHVYEIYVSTLRDVARNLSGMTRDQVEATLGAIKANMAQSSGITDAERAILDRELAAG